MTASGPRRMMREEQILEIVPVSHSTLWRMEKAGKFPRGTFISPNKKIWFEDEVVAWQNSVNEFQPNRGRGRGRPKKAHDGKSTDQPTSSRAHEQASEPAALTA